MKSSYFIVAVVLLLSASACNQQNKQAEEQSSTAGDTASATTQATIANDTTSLAYTEYLALKNALVASDAAKASQAARQLEQTLSKIDGCENTSKLAKNISNATDLAVQRKDFTSLSADLIALMKHTDISSGKVYVQHCPMANDGDGGYWLASDSEIRNPYYGDEMLNCGSVTEELK